MALSTNRIEFDSLLTGKKAYRDLVIKNQSQVPAKFEIRKIDKDAFKETAFTFDFMHGEIPAKSSFLLKCTYEPKIAFLDSVSHYEVSCEGGNTLSFQTRGFSSGNEVDFSTRSIDFGDVELGKNTSRLLTITNLNDLAIPFQFFSDKNNIFSLSATEGIVKAKSTFRVIISFKPVAAMNYYERIYCIIPNHGVLFVDLIGNSFDLLIRPKAIK